MNKKLLVILTAALLLLSATACNKGPGKDEETTDNKQIIDTKEPTTSAFIPAGTDNPATDEPTSPETREPETDAFDPSESNPTFSDASMKVVVVSAVATVRTSTRVEENNNNAVGWPSEGTILDVTGKSENWYRVSYTVNGEAKDCYIAKTVAADASVLDGFTDIENGEEVEIIVDAVYVRSYPSTDSSHSIRGSLKKGAKVTRVAVNDHWSRILYEVTAEGEVDDEGNPVVDIKQYYISNDCVKAVEAADDAQ